MIKVSRILNILPIHPTDVRAQNFRNPAGVVLKIANLRAFDRSTPSVGMSGGSRLDKAIYEEFEDAPLLVARAVEVVRQRYGITNDGFDSPLEAKQRRVAEESTPYSSTVDSVAIHIALEQDMQAIKARTDKSEAAKCEVCGFDFGRTYGPRGQGYIQFHHRTPLAEINEHTRPTPGDLHMICANCHTMLHTGDASITLEELKAIVRDTQRASIRELASRFTKPEE